MKTKKQSLKIVQIGTLFISLLGIVSISNGKISSLVKDADDFKLINTSFADDDEEEEDDREDDDRDEDENEDREDEDDDNRNDDDDDYNYNLNNPLVNTPVNNVTSPVTNTVIPTVNNNILSETIATISQTGANCKTVYETVYETGYTTSYETVYDTVTSASGRTSRVAKQVAKQTPKQIAKQVSHEVCEAIKTPVENTETTNTGVLNNEIKLTTQKLFKAPNSKVYSIIEEDGIVSIKKADGSYAKRTFNNYNEAVAYLNQNALPAPETYKAANGKYYTIMFENGKIVVKKSDWSYAKQTFATYAEARTYLDKNAPKQIIKKTVAKIASPVKKTTVLNTKVTKTVTAKATPKPVVKAPAPKVDTTTKAS